jgi:hypothetical protein
MLVFFILLDVTIVSYFVFHMRGRGISFDLIGALAFIMFLSIGDFSSDIFYILAEPYAYEGLRVGGIVVLFLPALAYILINREEQWKRLLALNEQAMYRPPKLNTMPRALGCLLNIILRWLLIPPIYLVALAIVVMFKLAAFPGVSEFFFDDRCKAFNEGVLSELLGESLPQLTLMIINSALMRATSGLFWFSAAFSGLIMGNSMWPIMYAVINEPKGLEHPLYIDVEKEEESARQTRETAAKAATGVSFDDIELVGSL